MPSRLLESYDEENESVGIRTVFEADVGNIEVEAEGGGRVRRSFVRGGATKCPSVLTVPVWVLADGLDCFGMDEPTCLPSYRTNVVLRSSRDRSWRLNWG